MPPGCNAHQAWSVLSEGEAIGGGWWHPALCSQRSLGLLESYEGCMHRAACEFGGFTISTWFVQSRTARIQLAGRESNRLVCLSLSFQIPFRFSISSAQAHPHNQLLSGQLPRCDIYRVYWKLLAHCWALKCDCFSK